MVSRSPSWGLKAFGVCIFAVGLVLALALEKIPILVVSYEEGRDERIVLRDGTFVHHFIHSIHTTAVDEYFTVEGNRLTLTGVAYDSYGVGMPTDEGLSFTLKDNRFYLRMERFFDRLDIRVSHVPDHGLVIDGELHPFVVRTKPETLVTLRAGRRFSISFRRLLTYGRNDSKR
jgi:hypothetical protein